MSRTIKALAIAAVITVIATASTLASGNGGFSVSARLIGYEEVPAVSSAARGTFKAWLSADGNSLRWELSYSGLEGDVLQAHTHFGQTAVNGGISVFYCTNLGNGPFGTQACPPAPATISGVVSAADVVGPVAQGISAGEWAEFVAAIRAGATYTNVHSAKFPGGEIRGQLKANTQNAQ